MRYFKCDGLHQIYHRLLSHDARVKLSALVCAARMIGRLHVRRPAMHINDLYAFVALAALAAKTAAA